MSEQVNLIVNEDASTESGCTLDSKFCQSKSASSVGNATAFTTTESCRSTIVGTGEDCTAVDTDTVPGNCSVSEKSEKNRESSETLIPVTIGSGEDLNIGTCTSETEKICSNHGTYGKSKHSSNAEKEISANIHEFQKLLSVLETGAANTDTNLIPREQLTPTEDCSNHVIDDEPLMSSVADMEFDAIVAEFEELFDNMTFEEDDSAVNLIPVKKLIPISGLFINSASAEDIDDMKNVDNVIILDNLYLAATDVDPKNSDQKRTNQAVHSKSIDHNLVNHTSNFGRPEFYCTDNASQNYTNSKFHGNSKSFNIQLDVEGFEKAVLTRIKKNTVPDNPTVSNMKSKPVSSIHNLKRKFNKRAKSNYCAPYQLKAESIDVEARSERQLNTPNSPEDTPIPGGAIRSVKWAQRIKFSEPVNRSVLNEFKAYLDLLFADLAQKLIPDRDRPNSGE